MKFFKVLALSCLVPISSQGEILSFKFVDSGDVAFAETEEAGALRFQASHWNFLQGALSSAAENNAVFTNLRNGEGLVTSSLEEIVNGAETGLVNYQAANTWRSGVGNATANDTIMNGYLDDGGDNLPVINFSFAADSLLRYTVVVYVHGDGSNAPMGRYWLEEWTDIATDGTVITDQIAMTGNDYNGTFQQAGSDFTTTLDPGNVTVMGGELLGLHRRDRS